MNLRFLVAIVVSLVSSQAHAAVGDKWRAGFSIFEHIADADNVAVLSWSREAKGGTGLVGYLFFPGLVDGKFGGLAGDGYYVLMDGGHCDKALEAPDGSASKNYGKAVIVFHDPPPPTGWTLIMGYCDGPPMGENSLRASPIE
jgi:hypothetical protein